MKIILTQSLLKHALDFISCSKNSTDSYSKYLWCKITNQKIEFRMVSGIINARIEYLDNSLEKEYSANFVVDVTKFQNFVTKNSGKISLEVFDNYIMMGGKGSLKLSYISSDVYEICQFNNDNKFNSNDEAGEYKLGLCEDASVISYYFDNFKLLMKWADTASNIHPIYKHTFFKDGIGSARFFAQNINVLATELKNNDSSLINCGAIVPVETLNMLLKTSNLQRLKVLSPIDKNNSLVIEGQNSDLQMTYYIESRLIEGEHPIDKLFSYSEKIEAEQQSITFENKLLLDFIKRAEGYSEKTPIVEISVTRKGLNLSVLADSDKYSDELKLEENNMPDTTFWFNLDALKKIASNMENEYTKIYGLKGDLGLFEKFCIKDNNMIYIFPSATK